MQMGLKVVPMISARDKTPSAYKLIFVRNQDKKRMRASDDQDGLSAPTQLKAEPSQPKANADRDAVKMAAEKEDMDTFFLMEYLKPAAKGADAAAVASSTASAAPNVAAHAVMVDAATDDAAAVHSAAGQASHAAEGASAVPDLSSAKFIFYSGSPCTSQRGAGSVQSYDDARISGLPSVQSVRLPPPMPSVPLGQENSLDNVLRLLQHQEQRLLQQHREMQRFLAGEHEAQDQKLTQLNQTELLQLKTKLHEKQEKRATQLKLVQMNEQDAQQRMHRQQIQHLEQQQMQYMQGVGAGGSGGGMSEPVRGGVGLAYDTQSHQQNEMLEQNMHRNSAMSLLRESQDDISRLLSPQMLPTSEAGQGALQLAGDQESNVSESFVSVLQAGLTALPPQIQMQTDTSMSTLEVMGDSHSQAQHKRDRIKELNKEHARTSRLRKKYYLQALQERMWNLYMVNFTLLQKVIPAMPEGQRDELIKVCNKGLALRSV
jgi:hypothetical protein